MIQQFNNSSESAQTDFKKVSFLGLGVMGYPMAGHLARAGFNVTVYNRTATKSERWVQEHSGQRALTPAEAAQDADAVVLCVGNDDDIRQVLNGPDGAFSTLKAGCLVIDHTTASATVAREMAKLASAKQADFIDAPVSGGQAGAENGVLSIMCGGPKNAYENALPLLAAYGKTIERMGDTGAGQLSKMVNQICIAGLLQGLSEALAFGERADLDMEKVLKVISDGAAGSWQLSNRGHTMLERSFDFGFAVDWMRKDLGLVLDEAKNNGALLPVTALVDQFYAEVQQLGGDRWDTSSLIQRLGKPDSK
ncbi:MAG TPA: NAD(P)-dependent oxidoreductase [Paenalcaligenes sp.]|nr:NAD(P)-dependent oxidoreductase [Paenalcaligenes sp.]